MNLQTVVNDLKSRMDTLTTHGQEVVKVLPDTLKQANDIFLHGFDSLVKSETAGAKKLFKSAKAGFEKARIDGFMAVVASPVEYLPPRDRLFDVFSDTVDIFSKTGDELYKTFRASLVPAKKPARTRKRKATTARGKTATAKKAAASRKPRKTTAASKKTTSASASDASTSTTH